MGKVLHQYALCDFDAADEFLGAMHPALLEVHAYMHMHLRKCVRHMAHVSVACTCDGHGACVVHAWCMRGTHLVHACHMHDHAAQLHCVATAGRRAAAAATRVRAAQYAAMRRWPAVLRAPAPAHALALRRHPRRDARFLHPHLHNRCRRRHRAAASACALRLARCGVHRPALPRVRRAALRGARQPAARLRRVRAASSAAPRCAPRAAAATAASCPGRLAGAMRRARAARLATPRRRWRRCRGRRERPCFARFQVAAPPAHAIAAAYCR